MKKKSMVFDIVYSPKNFAFPKLQKIKNQIYKWNKNEHNASIKGFEYYRKRDQQSKGRVERAL